MIKFHTGSEGGRHVVGLGLSERNLQHLRNRKPIHVKLAELGVPGDVDVLIFWGPTEEQMEAELEPYLRTLGPPP